MPKVEGVKAVLNELKKLEKMAKKADVSVIVGYTQNYAIYVHENLTARHKPGKIAKYLEKPARENANELKRIVVRTTKKTKSVARGLLSAGLALQRMSQRVVPVDTGALKASAFTKQENKV